MDIEKSKKVLKCFSYIFLVFAILSFVVSQILFYAPESWVIDILNVGNKEITDIHRYAITTGIGLIYISIFLQIESILLKEASKSKNLFIAIIFYIISIIETVAFAINNLNYIIYCGILLFFNIVALIITIKIKKSLKGGKYEI